MLITTDGSIGDISRQSYVEAEERIVGELKALGKPFAMILNSVNPTAESAMNLAYELEEKYGVPVALVSCLELDAEDIRHILELVLHEFPVSEIALHLPEWTRALDAEHPIRRSLLQSIRRCADRVNKIGDVKDAFADLGDNEYIKAA
jgi:stage IV sporulation protein A